MSLFESASLVVTPNGTKASKLYAIKPTDGSGDLSVVRATTATRVNSSGLIESVATNVPRLDYSNGSCPSILVEPQRTNLLERSEEFDNASWSKLNTSVTSNSVVSPNGTITADKIIPSATSSFKEIYNDSTLTSGVVYTQTYYVKADGYRYIQILSPSVNIGTMYANFDLQTATKTDGTSGYGSIQSVGNGWCKITATFTQLVTGIGRVSISIIPNSNSARIVSWTANGTDGILVWGAQLESGSNATSYIPTTTASVTRNADVISKTGISSLIGQTEGTIYMEVNVNSINNSAGRLLYTIYNNSTNARISSGIGTNNKIDLFVTGPPNVQTFSQTISTGKLKLSVSYKNSNIFLTVNGVLATAITTLNVPVSMNSLMLGAVFNGTFQLGDGIDLFAHWKTALTDQECINLTTI
jgi:hypothetical protein